jgi:hypothetical protein
VITVPVGSSAGAVDDVAEEELGSRFGAVDGVGAVVVGSGAEPEVSAPAHEHAPTARAAPAAAWSQRLLITSPLGLGGDQ